MRWTRARVDPSTTRIDNEYYDALGDEWWDPRGRAGGLHALNPARTQYFLRSIEAGIGRPLAGARVLDVGCGGGLVAEVLAKAGARVAGIDRSRVSLQAARRHHDTGPDSPGYACADAEALPFPDAAFDAVVSSDFLEHVHDLDAVVREMSRVVRPGGVVAFDTINRTLRARLVVIGLLEVVLRRIPRHTHDAKLFVKPAELRDAFARAGLAVREVRGLGPAGSPLAALRGILRGEPCFAIVDDTAISYVGWARRADAPTPSLS